MRIIIICSLIVISSLGLNIAYKMHAHMAQLNVARAQFFNVQQDLLSRISKVLAHAVKTRDLEAINHHLSAYEGVLFTLHLPVNLQIAIFDAPLQVIGLLAELAPDDNYYSQILQNPQQLAYSSVYTKAAMPDYPLINYGLGILDQSGSVLGVVEVKIPAAALQQKIAEQVPNNLVQNLLWLGAWHCLIMLGVGAGYWLFMRFRVKQLNEIQRLQAYIATQDKYDGMATTAVNFNIMQAVNDVHATVAVLSHAAGIELNFPPADARAIFCYCQPKELVQTLNEVSKNIIRQLGTKGSLQLEITLSNTMISFVFTDNGFYNQLDAAWGDLAEHVEYLHTTYVGNKIIYNLPRMVKNNVISLEQFQEV